MIRGLWSRNTIGWVLLLALLPAAAVLLASGGTGLLRLVAGLLAALFWQALFRQNLGVPLSPSGVVTALAVAVLGPETLAPWQIVLGVSFGLVVGELIFGGWGRNLVAAPVLALAFLSLSFPNLAPPTPEAAMALAAAASGVLLIGTGILPLGLVLAAAVAWAGGLAFAGHNPGAALVSGSFVFGLVFLIGDPVAAAATATGRWLYGALAGGLAAALADAGPGPEAVAPVIFAALLAQIFAPLIDHAVIAAALAARRRRHG